MKESATVRAPSYFVLRPREGLRFHDAPRCGRKDIRVPIEFLDRSLSRNGTPMPDNMMHRAPHPTIHIIRRADLELMSEQALARNSRLMFELYGQNLSAPSCQGRTMTTKYDVANKGNLDHRIPGPTWPDFNIYTILINSTSNIVIKIFLIRYKKFSLLQVVWTPNNVYSLIIRYDNVYQLVIS